MTNEKRVFSKARGAGVPKHSKYLAAHNAHMWSKMAKPAKQGCGRAGVLLIAFAKMGNANQHLAKFNHELALVATIGIITIIVASTP